MAEWFKHSIVNRGHVGSIPTLPAKHITGYVLTAKMLDCLSGDRGSIPLTLANAAEA